MDNNEEILTIDEAAEYLMMGRRSLYKLIKTSDIPHKRVLTKFRFVKKDLKEWVGGK
ncbi:helix-turn-helix domain-containing protein [Thermodesulfobacteriota bacterium]